MARSLVLISIFLYCGWPFWDQASREWTGFVETMNIALLQQTDDAEWNRCYKRMHAVALKAARKFLFANIYSEQDREDLAVKVINQFHTTLRAGHIQRCRNQRDVECWIWSRTSWRAIDIIRMGGQALFDRGDEQEAADVPVERPPISDEARIDELIAYARCLPAGFSPQEEEAYRAVEVGGQKQREYAKEAGKPPGTVARLVSAAKRKIADVKTLEGCGCFRRFREEKSREGHILLNKEARTSVSKRASPHH